jgi:hypothetical protein
MSANLTNFVPYTGATGNVNLGSNSLIVGNDVTVGDDVTIAGDLSVTGTTNLSDTNINGDIDFNGLFLIAGSSGTVNQILVSQGVGLSPIWADNAAVSIPISSGLSAQGINNTTTSLMSQGINIFSTVTLTDFCTKLPNVATGISVKIINNGVTNLRVFPYDPADSINGLPAGAYAIVPNDNKLYEFISL